MFKSRWIAGLNNIFYMYADSNTLTGTMLTLTGSPRSSPSSRSTASVAE